MQKAINMAETAPINESGL